MPFLYEKESIKHPKSGVDSILKKIDTSRYSGHPQHYTIYNLCNYKPKLKKVSVCTTCPIREQPSCEASQKSISLRTILSTSKRRKIALHSGEPTASNNISSSALAKSLVTASRRNPHRKFSHTRPPRAYMLLSSCPRGTYPPSKLQIVAAANAT